MPPKTKERQCANVFALQRWSEQSDGADERYQRKDEVEDKTTGQAWKGDQYNYMSRLF